jgi:hypothetical protein
VCDSREVAVAAVGAAQGSKYCGVYLSMLYIGYDRPCNTITIDAAAAAALAGSARKPSAASLLKVHNITKQHLCSVTGILLAMLT